MDLTFSEPEIAFRDELRAWFAANDPGAEPPHHEEELHFAWRRDFQRRLFDGGWAAPHWPVEHGGRGATLTQSAIFFEELGRARAPALGRPDRRGRRARAARGRRRRRPGRGAAREGRDPAPAMSARRSAARAQRSPPSSSASAGGRST